MVSLSPPTERREDFYRRLLESSPEGVVLVDAQDAGHPVVYVNPGFETLTGYAAADLIGKNLRLLQSDDRDQDARHRLREALGKGETCRYRNIEVQCGPRGLPGVLPDRWRNSPGKANALAAWICWHRWRRGR